MKLSHFVGVQWIAAGVLALAISNNVRAQCKSIVFDTPTYTTTGGTQPSGSASLIGQDGICTPPPPDCWFAGNGTPLNTMISISSSQSYSGTQSVKVTTTNSTPANGNLVEAIKTFNGCGTTTDTGLISVRMKYKNPSPNANVGTLVKPQSSDAAGNVFGFFQISGDGTMKGRGGALTNVNTDNVNPGNYPGNVAGVLYPSNGWHDLEMRLNPSPATITDPQTGVDIPFGKVLYLINGNPIPAIGTTNGVQNENPMVYYGGSNTSGQVARFTIRRETTAGPSDIAIVYLDNWEVWSHPRPIAKAHTLTVSLNASGNATVTGANIDNSSLGGDLSQSITDRSANPSSFTCANLGSNSVTLTVTQSDGQTAQAVTTVTVQDTTSPNITFCGNNQSTISVNANCQAAVPNFTSAVTATDNCTASGSLTKTQSPVAGTLVYPGITVVTITVKDASLNQSQCTRNFTVNAPDTDGDGTPDCDDSCPNDPNKITPGTCGCGIADTDSDGDGTPNCNDGCPSDPLKTTPGLCGCNVPETDTDGDGTLDCLDGCPNDPNKIAPGQCGCGVPEGTCARTITQWRSVRTHGGGAGELAIVLDATATTLATVETRGGTPVTQGVFKVQVDFDGPVTLVNAANITVTYRPTIQGGSPSIGSPVSVIPSSVVMSDADTLDMIFTSGQIPNLGCANINIGAGTFAETLTGDTDCNIRVLAGDMNSSGGVATTDQSAMKAEVSAGTLATAKPKFDLNLSGGNINTTDQSVMKSMVVSPTKTALCP